MNAEDLTLTGRYITLEALGRRHVHSLISAAAVDSSLYQWSPVPQGKNGVWNYVETALAWRDAGTAMPFAIVRRSDAVTLLDAMNTGHDGTLTTIHASSPQGALRRIAGSPFAL